MNFATKKRNNVYEVTLRLPDIKYLFVAPEPDPFSSYYEEYSYTSGIEFIAETFYADPTLRSALLAIRLPADKVRPGLAEETQEAIRRYCRNRISYVEHEVRGLRWRSLRALAFGLVALVVLLGTSKLASSSTSPLVQLLGEGLGIAAWVAIWFPLDSLLFSVPQRSMALRTGAGILGDAAYEAKAGESGMARRYLSGVSPRITQGVTQAGYTPQASGV